MNTKVQGRNYLVQEYDEVPAKWNKKKTDKALSNAKKALEQLSSAIKSADEISPFLSYTIYRELVTPHDYDWDAIDIVDQIQWGIKQIVQLQEDLTEDDELINPVNHTNLEDLGFRTFGGFYKGTGLFEKRIVDTDEKEIVEEVVFLSDGTIKRRERTTIWKKVPYGRSSESIKYKPLRMTKKLKLAAANTLKERGVLNGQ